MSDLSCSCDDDYEWFYTFPDDHSSMLMQSNCYDCGKIIKRHDTYYPIYCYEIDEDYDEVFIRNIHFCEACGDILLNLQELGFCVSIDSFKNSKSMQSLLRQYQEVYMKSGEIK